MKIIKKIFFLTFVGASCTTFAYSPYVSVQLGGFPSPIHSETSEGGVAGRIGAGLKWDTTNRFKLGLETGANVYQNTKFVAFSYNTWSVSQIQGNYERWSLDALTVADWYALPKFDLFAKAGVAYVWQTFSSETPGVEFTPHTKNGLAGRWSLGMGYDVSKKINVNFTVEHQMTDHLDKLSILPARTYMVGFRYMY